VVTKQALIRTAKLIRFKQKQKMTGAKRQQLSLPFIKKLFNIHGAAVKQLVFALLSAAILLASSSSSGVAAQDEFKFVCDAGDSARYATQVNTLEGTMSNHQYNNLIDFASTGPDNSMFALYNFPVTTAGTNESYAIFHFNFDTQKVTKVASTSDANSQIFSLGSSNTFNNSRIVAIAQRSRVNGVSSPDASLHFLFFDSQRLALVNQFAWSDYNKQLDPVYNYKGELSGVEGDFNTLAATNAPFITFTSSNPVSLLTLASFNVQDSLTFKPMQAALVSSADSIKLFLYKDYLTATPLSKLVILPVVANRTVPLNIGLTNIGSYIPFRLGNLDTEAKVQYLYLTMRVYENEIRAFETHHNLERNTVLQLSYNKGVVPGFPFDYVQVLMEVQVLQNGTMTVTSISQVNREGYDTRIYDMSITPVTKHPMAQEQKYNQEPVVIVAGSRSKSNVGTASCGYVGAFKRVLTNTTTTRVITTTTMINVNVTVNVTTTSNNTITTNSTIVTNSTMNGNGTVTTNSTSSTTTTTTITNTTTIVITNTTVITTSVIAMRWQQSQSSCLAGFEAAEIYGLDLINTTVVAAGIAQITSKFIGSVVYMMNLNPRSYGSLTTDVNGQPITQAQPPVLTTAYYQYLDAIGQQSSKPYQYEYVMNVRFTQNGKIILGRSYQATDLGSGYSYLGELQFFCLNDGGLKYILIVSVITGVAFLAALAFVTVVVILLGRVIKSISISGPSDTIPLRDIEVDGDSNPNRDSLALDQQPRLSDATLQPQQADGAAEPQ